MLSDSQKAFQPILCESVCWDIAMALAVRVHSHGNFSLNHSVGTFTWQKAVEKSPKARGKLYCQNC